MHCNIRLICLLFWSFIVTFNFSCERLSDRLDSNELSCGKDDYADRRVYKIEVDPPAGEVEVWQISPQGEVFMRIPVNRKNCFSTPLKSEGFLVVKSSGLEGRMRGTVLRIQAQDHQRSIEAITLTPLQLTEAQIQICPAKSIFTRDTQLLLPVSYSTPGLDSFLVIEAEGPSGVSRRVLAEGLGLREANMELKGLKSGSNTFAFKVYDLFLSARRTSEQRCEVISDKDAPQVRIKDTQNRFVSQANADFLPGDKLVVEANEASDLRYCFQSEEKQDKLECGNVPDNRILGLPSSGRWMFFIYATDPAGNSISTSQHIRVFNRTAVDLIRTQAQLLTEREVSNDPRQAIKLEEDRLKLVGTEEQSELEIDTKVSMLSALVRTQERSRVRIDCSMKRPHVRIADVLAVLQDSSEACLYRLDGTFLGKVNHPSINSLFEGELRVTQNRYAIFDSKNRFLVLDTVELTLRDIALPSGSRKLKAFDVDRVQGSIYALIDTSFVIIGFDGQLLSSLPLSGEYIDLTLIARKNESKIVFRYLDFRQNFSELCDLQRLSCSKPIEALFFLSDRYWVNDSASHLITNYEDETLLWSTAELYELDREKAFSIPGKFVRFLDDKHILIKNQESYAVWELKRYSQVHVQPVSTKARMPLLYDPRHKQGIEIMPSGFNRWQDSKFTETVLIADQDVSYANFNSLGNELTIFTSTHVVKYFLAYRPATNQNNYVFSSKRSGLYIRSESEVIYTHANGERRTFSGDNISVSMSPQRKFALIINSRDQGTWSVINESGKVLASSLDSGNIVPNAAWLANEDETLVHLARPNSPHLVIDTRGEGRRYLAPSVKLQNPADSSSPVMDTYELSFTAMENRILLVGQESVELFNLSDGSRQMVSQGFILEALSFLRFPLVSYVSEDETSRKRILQDLGSERRLEWNDDAYTDVDNLEECGVFVLKHGSKITLVDLSDFSQHEYEAMGASCHEATKRLTLVDADRSQNRLLEPNLEAVTILPGNVLKADAHGFWLRSPDFTTLIRFPLEANNSSLSRTFSSPRYDEFNLLNHIFLVTDFDRDTVYTAELYNTKLELVASRTILPQNRLGIFTKFGPLVWNLDNDEIFEMDVDENSQPEFVPVPSWEGIRFLPFENDRLLEALQIWIDNAT